ncbi:MAG: type III pantothenate kinase, partial [Mycobacterium sp.]|nr:type III pantothenate kinase [Mycobacterium sp.]
LLVDNPREIGPDRIANALAAYQRYRSAVLVVDIGVSTVVDVVSAKGEFLGGVIAPGVQLSADALVERAALRRVELQRPRSVVGKNTVEAIQSGAVFGFAALVDGVIERIRTDIDGFSESAAPAVVTGAYAELLVDASRTLTELHPNLTLEGLKLLFARNRRR